MNAQQAKEILVLYRQHTADRRDPDVAAALAYAQTDPELADWLAMHCAREYVIGEKFRAIPVPAGLKEQIISEAAASRRRPPVRRSVGLVAALVAVMLIAGCLIWQQVSSPAQNTLAIFQEQMAGVALRGYAMDLITQNPEQIRAFLQNAQAPADYTLPAALQRAAESGCAVAGWQKQKVSMLCFTTGRPLAAGSASDLWLFVADAGSVQGAPAEATIQINQVNRLITATWVKGGRLYMLGLEGSPDDLKKFL